MQLDKVRIFPLPKIYDERGNLSFFENNCFFPFEIEWVSWIFANYKTESQLEPAYTNQSQVIIVFSGNIYLELKDGHHVKKIKLDCQINCIYIPSMIYYEIKYCSDKTAVFVASCKMPDTLEEVKDLLQYKKISNEKYQLLD